MKIAYIIIAHIDPEHISRLSDKLTKGTAHHAFIHVDKKVPIEPFIEAVGINGQVHFVSDRVDVKWSAMSSIHATINIFRQAYQYNPHFDRYIIIQGLCYPIRSNHEIVNFFMQDKDHEFIKASNETQSKNWLDRHKYVLYWYPDAKNIFQKAINLFNRLMMKVGLKIPFRRPSITIDEKKYEIYRGWAHIAITGKAVAYILDFYDKNPKFNKYFSTVLCSDESYFHTILYNSPFINNLPEVRGRNENKHNVLYFEYPDEVRIFKYKAEYQLLYDTGLLYFRKANSESKELLDYIDDIHHKGSPYLDEPPQNSIL